MGKNKKNQIRVSFVGNNAEDVTGSMTFIQTQSKQILLECGLIQGSSTLLTDYKANTQKFKFKPRDIDYIFIGHTHVDHIGLLPRLYAQGCTAKIIAPSGTYDLAKILMNDSAFIMSKDVESLKRKLGKEYPPIYNNADVDTCLQYWNEYGLDTKIVMDDEVEFRFTGSGHIINACQTELWVTSGNETKKILYTSDLGSRNIPKHYTTKFNPVDKANLVIGETTYADERKPSTMKTRKLDLEKIKSVVHDVCYDNRGKVLIPTFALDRTQNMITFLYDLFHEDEDCPIVLVDSPMACKITKLYEGLLEGEEREKYSKIINWDKLKLVEEYAESKSYQTLNKPMIILSCSGMMTNGRSVTWAGKLLPNPKNCILFVGYSVNNSLAYKIKQGRYKTLKIEGKPVANKCNIINLHSFSSHAQHDELLKYYSEILCERVALVHGNMNGKIAFAKELQEEIARKNHSGKVVCVNHSTSIIL